MLDHLTCPDVNAHAGAAALDVRDRGNARKCLTAEPEAGDGVEVGEGRDLAGRVAHKCKRQLVRGNSGSVVAYTNRRPSGTSHVGADAARVGIEGVFDELFDNRCGTFDHLPGGDRIRDLGQEDANLRHRSNLERSSYSFCRASRGLSVSGWISSSSLRSGSGAISIGKPSCCSGGSSGRWRSSSASTWRARAMTPEGSPASAATWMPYERSAPPGTTRCKKRTVSPSSSTSTRSLRTRGRRSASAVSS